VSDGLFSPQVGDPLLDGRPETARMPTGQKFTRIWKSWLLDRSWDAYFPAKLRLYLYLRILTRDGLGRSVRLTNGTAAEIGLTRQQKHDCLRELEKDGLVTLVRDGHAAPEVAVTPVSPPATRVQI
jgi:hypothetical protein